MRYKQGSDIVIRHKHYIRKISNEDLHHGDVVSKSAIKLFVNMLLQLLIHFPVLSLEALFCLFGLTTRRLQIYPKYQRNFLNKQ